MARKEAKDRSEDDEDVAREPRGGMPLPGARAHLLALEGGASCVLEVRAQPGSKRTGFAGFWNGMPKIATSAAPERGKANEEIAREVAKLFGVRGSAVVLVGGDTARVKRFKIVCPIEVVTRRLDELMKLEEDEEE